jgi:hypothetical protein
MNQSKRWGLLMEEKTWREKNVTRVSLCLYFPGVCARFYLIPYMHDIFHVRSTCEQRQNLVKIDLGGKGWLLLMQEQVEIFKNLYCRTGTKLIYSANSRPESENLT